MNFLLRRMLNLDLLRDMSDIAVEQQTVINDQRRIIDSQMREIARIKLEYTRWGRDIVGNFIIALDKPEEQEEIRDILHEALSDLSDEVARIEEHAPS